MKPDEVNISEAGNTYLIANTPLFLMRRLQTDSSVEALSRQCTGEDLYTATIEALQKNPENSNDAVRPVFDSNSPPKFSRSLFQGCEFAFCVPPLVLDRRSGVGNDLYSASKRVDLGRFP